MCTAYARNMEGKKTRIPRDCLDGFSSFVFLLEKTTLLLSNNVKINYHTAHARNMEGKKT